MDTFHGEAVGVTGTVALDQSMSLEFAQVVAQLVEAVISLGEMESGEDGLMDLLALTRTVQQYSGMSCGGEYIDNLLDGFVGAVVCGFELAIWTVVRIRAVVEAAVGDRSTEPFMEEQK